MRKPEIIHIVYLMELHFFLLSPLFVFFFFLRYIFIHCSVLFLAFTFMASFGGILNHYLITHDDNMCLTFLNYN